MNKKKNTEKKGEPKVYREGNNGVITSANNAYSFSIAATDTDWSDEINNFYSSKKWDIQPVTVGGFDVVPYGASNNLPQELRDILEVQHLAEGIFKRQRGLTWGQGPGLYTIDKTTGQHVKQFVEDKEIDAWLKTWDYKEYLRRCIVDYYHTEGVFNKFFLNRGARIGMSPFIAKIEHVSAHHSRVGWPESGKVTRYVTGDFDLYKNINAYPVFDPTDPFKFRISMGYYNMYSFGRDIYPIPSYYGSLNWINRSSAIPQILKSLTDNSLNIKWHIKSPLSYWESKAEQLKAQCVENNTVYTSQMLEDLKDETFKKLAEVLSGVKNVGKFFTSETSLDQYGKMEGWEIIPIDQKVSDFITSQLSIAQYADGAVASGLGLSPTLSNILVEGKLSSGSEQLYALKLYLATDIDIPESIICQAINYAIEANWPEKNIKMGFYHDVVKTEENVTPAQRVKNKV